MMNYVAANFLVIYIFLIYNEIMKEILRTTEPIAHKEHTCMWCNGKINVGEKYKRTTIVYNGDLYDWTEHKHCGEVAYKLDMFDYEDDDLNDESFRATLADYVYEKHYDDKIDDIAKDWQLDTPELAVKIAKELKVL